MANGKIRGWIFHPLPRPKPFWKSVRTLGFGLTVAFLMVVTDIFTGFWILRYPNLLANDRLAWLRPSIDATFTEVVTIEPEDYKTWFGEKSPLDPRKLGEAIDLILKRRPAVLVVDLDTADPSFADLPVSGSPIPIVWGRALYSVPVNRGLTETWVRNVLGRASADVNQGFAVANLDPDGTSRALDREIKVEGKWFPALHWRAVTEFRRVLRQGPAEPQASLSRRYGSGDRIPLAARFHRDRHTLGGLAAAKPGDPPDFGGKKVVLLGGKYDGGDVVATPFGPEWGVDLLAAAVEIELAGVRVPAVPKLVKYPLKIALALLIAWIYYRFKPIAATLLVVFGLLPVVLFANAVAVLAWGVEGLMVPFAVGVLIEQLATLAETAQHMSGTGGSHGHA